MKRGFAIALMILLSSCGSRLHGTYSDSMGLTSFTFKSGGKVAMTTMGIETELDYKVEDGKVKIGTEKGAMVLTLLDDGSIRGPMGMKLEKQKD